MARAPKSPAAVTSPMSASAFALSPHAIHLAAAKFYGSAQGKAALEAARAAAPVSPEPILVNGSLVVDAAVTVDADWERPATVTISRVLVAMAMEAAVSAALQAAVETIRTKNGAAVAEAVMSAFGGSDAESITSAIVRDAARRWNASDAETDALKARWEDTFQGKVTGAPQAVRGSVHVRPMAGMKSAVRVSE